MSLKKIKFKIRQLVTVMFVSLVIKISFIAPLKRSITLVSKFKYYNKSLLNAFQSIMFKFMAQE